MWQGCDPPGPSALLRGERLIHDGKYQAAIESLREATTLLPNNPQAWNHLGLAYHWARQYNQAVQAYRRAVELNVDLAAARFNLGSLLLEINQPQLAANEFAAYTLLVPNQVEGWVRRGMAEWRARNWNAAYESFQQALQINPARPIVWNSVGIIELYRKNPAGADKAFRKALEYKPDYAPAIYNVALVAQFHLPQSPADQRAFALGKYREYLALQPTPLFTDVIRGLADKLDAELNPRPPAPVQTNTVAVRPPPPPVTNSPPVVPPPATTNTVAIARVEPSQPDIPAVAETATNSIPIPPEPIKPPEPVKPTNIVVTPAMPVTNTVQVARATPTEKVKVSLPPPPTTTVAPPVENNRTAALPMQPSTTDSSLAEAVARNLDQALKTEGSVSTTTTVKVSIPTPPPVASDFEDIGPNYTGLRYTYLNPPAPSAGFRHKAKSHFEEGRRLQKLRQWDNAITAYGRAIHWDGSYFEAYHNLGLAASANNDFLRSAIACETALAIQPNSAGTRYNFAVLLNGKGYFRDAAIELEKLLQQSPEDVKSHLLLATIYDKQLKQVGKARAHYQRVLNLEPAHPQGTAIRYWLRRN